MKTWLSKLAGVITLALALMIGAPAPIQAAQNATSCPTTGTLSGLALVQCINNAFSTTVSQFSGASAPASPTTWQLWADTTTNILKIYDGTIWEPIGSFSGSQWVPFSNGVNPTAISTTGSANAYVLTYSPAPTALVTGQVYPAIANFSNTGSATLNINSLGAKNITKNGTTALASGDIASGQVFLAVYDGTEFQLVTPMSIHGGLIDVIYMTSSGTYNKNASASFIEVEVVGGGGSGGGCAATGSGTSSAATGGAAGGAARKKIDNASLSATTAVTVGLGGAAPAAGSNNGNAGGTSSFGSFVSATGGNPGNGGAAASGTGFAGTGGTGGVGSSGDQNLSGGAGGVGYVTAATGNVLSGHGGASIYGEGGVEVGQGSGNPGVNPGSGGSGASSGNSQPARSGGAGANGVVIIREYN